MFPGPFSSQGPGNHARQMVSATDFYSLKEKMNNDMLFDFYNLGILIQNYKRPHKTIVH